MSDNVPGSCETGLLELPPCALPNEEHFGVFKFLQKMLYHTIDIGLVTVKQELISYLFCLTVHWFFEQHRQTIGC